MPELDDIFGALADPTRRLVVQTLLSQDTVTVPELVAELPISRQAVAKHVQVLDDAGLVERESTSGREVRYRLRPGALAPAATWMSAADEKWSRRLDRLKQAAESRA